MSERDGYQHGVPCWVDTWQPDAEAAVAFYSGVFDWDCEETSPPGAPRRHFMCNLRGRRVAGIGSPVPVPGHDPVWGTYVSVDDLDETVANAKDAGGKVAMEPFEALDGGQMSLLVDPTGGVFMAWRNGENNGAQLVNEPGAWSMSVLHTRDLGTAKDFYAAVFGWTYESFEAGDREMTIARVPGYEGGEPEQPVSRETVAVATDMTADGFPDEVSAHWGVDFWISDADAAAEKAKELGGAVVNPPADTPGFRSAVLADPQGAVFTVSQLLAA
jgi:predicted enzyme related to lactoylglutathione lyase